MNKAMNKTTNCGQSNARNSTARNITVWDPLVRIIHWGLALAILLNATIIDDDSNLHIMIGYATLGLVIVRLVWGWIGSKYAKFSAFPPNPGAALRYLKGLAKGDKTLHLSHNPMGALMVYNIWATVLLIAATGYMMGTTRFFGMEWVEEIHEIAFGWLILSIALHIGGVIFDSLHSGVPLVKSMVNGKKRIPGNRLNDD